MLKQLAINSFSKWNIFLLLILPVLLLISPWVVNGLGFPTILIQELDHCPELACDFSRHYLTQAQFLVDGVENMDEGWFYPPLLAILLTPMTLMGNPVLVWTVFNLVAVLGVIFWMAKITFGRSSILWSLALCSTSLPILHSIKWGQISLILTVGLLYFLLSERSEIKRGITLGVISAIKIYPIVFLLKPLVDMRIKLVIVSVLSFLVLGALFPLFVLGDHISNYWDSFERGQQLVPNIAITFGGQSLSPTFHRWFISGAHIEGEWSLDPVLMYFPMLKLIGLMTMFILGVLTLRNSWERRIEHLWTLQMLTIVHLFIQPGWVHYFCFIPLVQIYFWKHANRIGRVFVVASVVLERVPIWWLDKEVYFGFVRSGGLTMVMLLLWLASSCHKDSLEVS